MNAGMFRCRDDAISFYYILSFKFTRRRFDSGSMFLFYCDLAPCPVVQPSQTSSAVAFPMPHHQRNCVGPKSSYNLGLNEEKKTFHTRVRSYPIVVTISDPVRRGNQGPTRITLIDLLLLVVLQEVLGVGLTLMLFYEFNPRKKLFLAV